MKEIKSIKLTPAKAIEFLANIAPDKQRRYRPNHATKLAEAMRRGEFTKNNDMLMIGVNGELLNGQHRCNAVRIN